jgi:hypothetical protein
MRILNFLMIIIWISGCKKSIQSNNLGSIKKVENIRAEASRDSVKIVGERILNGDKISGKNEEYIFPLMDSLTNKNNRSFYFKVFSKITEQADGYIAEVIGLHVLKYFEFNPVEFIQNAKNIPEKTFNSMARFAGEEIAMSSLNLSKAEEEFEKLKSQTMMKCKDISEPDKLMLDQFFKQMKSGLNPEIIK